MTEGPAESSQIGDDKDPSGTMGAADTVEGCADSLLRQAQQFNEWVASGADVTINWCRCACVKLFLTRPLFVRLNGRETVPLKGDAMDIEGSYVMHHQFIAG